MESKVYDLSLSGIHYSPAGATVKFILQTETFSVAHCTLSKGQLSKRVRHKTVTEVWYVLKGKGNLYRKSAQGPGGKVYLAPGHSIQIPRGCVFQYQASPCENLVFLCITSPPWPGPQEVEYVDSKL